MIGELEEAGFEGDELVIGADDTYPVGALLTGGEDENAGELAGTELGNGEPLTRVDEARSVGEKVPLALVGCSINDVDDEEVRMTGTR